MNVVHHTPYEKTDSEVVAKEETYNYFAWIVRAGIFLIATLGFWYLILLNSLATSGFVLEEIKAERITIQKELEQWEIDLAIPTSLYALESSEQVQMMETVEKKSFIRVEQDQYAYIPKAQ